MIDYNDFLKQAESDISEAEKKFDEKDYGRAIFAAQQGLEKYIKAYLLKEKIFEDPKQLGHLTYHKIIKKIIEHLKEMVKLTIGYPMVTIFVNSVIKIFENHYQIFDKLNKSESLQKILWKSSLKIMLNNDEVIIAKNLLIDFEKGISESKKSKENIFSELMSAPSTLPKYNIALPDLISLIDIVPKLLGLVSTHEDLSELYKKYLDILSHYYKGDEILTEKTMQTMRNYQKILKILSANTLTETLQAFSHEQISRYPTKIDSKMSTEWYVEKKDELWNLIQRIKESSNKFKKIIES